MTLGEVNENDEVIEIGGIEFIFDKDLQKKVTPVKIDYRMKPPWERGFVLTSGKVVSPGEGACNIR